jgi:glucose 1-dehydrogenase
MPVRPQHTAIVTGAASGIGLATARRLAADGARVVLADWHKEKLDAAVAALMGDGLEVAGQVCDVSDPAQVEACAAAAVARYGRLDIVVNNAAVMVFKPLGELTPEDWQKVLGVGLLGAAAFTREAFRRMTAGGAIVNIASVHAVETSPLVAPYAAAKAALLSLTRSAAIEGRELGIRANAILPGAIDTPMLWDNPNLKSGAEVLDPKDIGRPEDVAAAVAFLASDEARFISGAALNVDGGRLARL